MADELAPPSGYGFGRRYCRNSPTKSIMYPKNRQAILQSTPNRHSLPENLSSALTAVIINPISEDFELEEVMNTPSLREEMISNPVTRARLISASGSRQSRPSKRISSHIFGSVSLLDSMDITPNSTPSDNNTPVITFTPLQRIPPPMRLSQAVCYIYISYICFLSILYYFISL